MLYDDKPARLASIGEFPVAGGATFTMGREHVQDALKTLMRTTGKRLACDIETHGLGLDALRIKSVAYSSATDAVVLDPRDPYQEVMIQQVNAAARELVFHNSPYDVPSLYLNGLITSADIRKVTDTLIYARMANPDELSPKSLYAAAQRYLQLAGRDAIVSAFKALGLSKKEGYRRFDLDRMLFAQGAASDPLITAQLLPIVRQAALAKLTEGHPFTKYGVTGDEALRLVEREQVINRTMLARSCRGYLVDFEYLERYQEENGAAILEAEQALRSHGIRTGEADGVKKPSAPDLMKVLTEMGAVPADHPLTATGKLSTTAESLKGLDHPLAQSFTGLVQRLHVRDDYLQKIVTLADANGRVHPTMNLLAATTGRASMGDPPFHQLPGPARRIILADEPGGWSSIDWSQVEPFTAASVAKDTQVIEAYEAGVSDVYTALGVGAGLLPPGTTSADCEISVNPTFYKIRKELKIVLLGLLYGKGLKLLTAEMGLPPGEQTTNWKGELTYDYAPAQVIKDAVFRAMPETAKLIKRLEGLAVQYQKVFTLSGRILDVPMERWNDSGPWRPAKRKGVNYFVQGSAYDLMAEALVGCIEAGYGDAIHITMHDELVVSTEAKTEVQRIMERAPERFVMLAGRVPRLRTDSADLGPRWDAA